MSKRKQEFDPLGLMEEIPPQQTPEEAEASIRALRAEIEALRAQLASREIEESRKQATQSSSFGDAGVGGWPWMYWRRPDGWITVGPGGATPKGHRNVGVYNDYLSKGMEPLDKYGYIQPPTHPEGSSYFVPLLRRGGAKEFPLSQILAYKWHLRPPIPGFKFPQYEAVKDEVQRAVCPQCDLELWAPPGDLSIGNTLFNHLWSTHEFDPEKAEKLCHAQGFEYVRQNITDELTVERNRRAAAKALRRKAAERVE